MLRKVSPTLTLSPYRATLQTRDDRPGTASLRARRISGSTAAPSKRRGKRYRRRPCNVGETDLKSKVRAARTRSKRSSYSAFAATVSVCCSISLRPSLLDASAKLC